MQARRTVRGMDKIPGFLAASSRRQLLQAGLAASVPVVAAGRASAAPARSDATPAGTAIDEVLALLSAQKDAWNRGDIAGFCSHYAADCVFLSPSGVSRGRSTVESRYVQKYGAAKASMGRLDFDILDRRESTDGVSLAMRWTLRWPDRPAPTSVATGLTLIVWQRHRGGWHLVQDASM